MVGWLPCKPEAQARECGWLVEWMADSLASAAGLDEIEPLNRSVTVNSWMLPVVTLTPAVGVSDNPAPFRKSA